MPATTSQLHELLSDPWAVPLESVDPSFAELFEHQTHLEVFRRLREQAPVHFTPESQFGPFWSITKFDHIREVEANVSVFSSEPTVAIGDLPEDLETPMFIASDPPKHGIQRGAVTPAVSSKRLAELEDLIRERVCMILDSLPRGETFNWVERVSIELTTQMLATLFDIPLEDRHLLLEWSEASTTAPAAGLDVDEQARFAVLQEALEYFSRLWAKRLEAEPGSDFISLLAHNPDTCHMIEEPYEFLGNVMLLIVGGNDTTRNSISGGVVALNQFPEEYAKLRADHGLIPNMVSEIIRWQTPISHMRRLAKEDFEFRGKTIRKGDKVVLWYASGNRDSDAIDQPDRFLIDREKARQHLSFGFGIHRCMGSRVAEMQLRIVWEEIMKRFEQIELVGEPVWVRSNFVRGFSDVPVRIPA